MKDPRPARRPPRPGDAPAPTPATTPDRPIALPALRVLAVLVALAVHLPLTGQVPEGQGAGARVQGLPPAPPPAGIRPSDPRPEAPKAPGMEPRRASAIAFGVPLVVEVHGMPQAEADAALRAAVEAVRELEALLDPEGDPDGEGLAHLNANAGEDPVPVHPDLVAVLERGLAFCRWSDQAHGPLGGRLYRLWGLRSPAPGRPSGAQLESAARAAACNRVAVEAAASGGDGGESPPRAQLAAGSELDLWGFARGFAVDRAIEVLKELGSEDALVELGAVRRAFGPGVDGRGWPVTLPVFPGQTAPLDRIWLQDDALAVASAVHRPLLVGGDRYAPYVDQRSGRPAEGVTAVVTVSELAVDAEALAASLMILGNRQGLLRVGNLRPTPHVLWLLGSGDAQPVLTQHNWTGVSRR